MDAATRARELALLGIEVRATQSQNTGTGGGYQPPHVPAGSSKGGQFGTTAGTSSAPAGYKSILPPDSAYKSGSGGKKKSSAAPANTPQAPTTLRTMKVGDSGEDVRYAQYAMNLLGFKVAQDGQYGPETEAAVKQMQERLGVAKPNGHLSPSMLHKMQDAVRLSPCVGAGQRDLAFEAAWEARDLEDVDDDVPDTEALIAALGEFIGADERSFSEALHPRNPKGPGGGRFRSIVDRVVDALSEWKKGDGPDDPLKDFNREQLLKAAKAHGHTFRRGASIEEIKAQILDDVRNGAKAEKAEAPHLPGAPKDHRRFTIQLGGKVAGTGHVANDAQARAGWKPGDKLTMRGRGEVTYHGPDEHDVSGRGAPSGAQWVEFADGEVGMVSADRLSGYVPPPKPSGTATDVGIFGNPSTGKLSLYRESDTGKRTGRAIKSFDDMGSLESWARDNGHTELADYAKAEQAKTGAPSAPAAKKAEAALPSGAAKATPQLPARKSSPLIFDLHRAAAAEGVSDAELDKMREAIRIARPDIYLGNEAHDTSSGFGAFAAHSTFRDHPELGKFYENHRAIYNHLVQEERIPREWTNIYAGHAAEAQAEATRNARKAVAGKPVVVRLNDESTLQSILADGRFKNQLETGTSMGGFVDAGLRKDYEEMAFGLPQDAPAAKRPIYGYVAAGGLDKDNGDKLAQYGNIRIVLKDSVRDRTTAGVGDSLDRRKEMRPAPINDMDWQAIQPGATHALKNPSSKTFQDAYYIEAQVHGGVSTSDIAEVVFPEQPSAEAVKALDSHGISWRVMRPGDKPPPVSPAPTKAGPDPATILSSLPSDLTPAQKRARLRSRGVPKEQIDALVPLAPRKKATKAARSLALLDDVRALGHDVTPGHDELHHYWTVGAGRQKWVHSPKPWTTLVALLTRHVGPEKAKIYASRWFIEVKGYAAGSDLNRVAHGHPPRGHRIGPG